MTRDLSGNFSIALMVFAVAPLPFALMSWFAAAPERKPASVPHEPFVQVVAPLPEVQLIETLVLNQIHFASIAASKAARIVLAVGGRRAIDFGSRRAHGMDAGLIVARAAYLAGCDGTSLVEAGRRYGIPHLRHDGAQLHPGAR